MKPEILMLLSKGLTEKALADVLRSGRADQSFLNGLAMLLDPLPGKVPRYRLQIKNGAEGREKGPTFDVNALVAALRDLEAREPNKSKRKPLRAEILERFGVSERTASAAVKRADDDDALARRLDELSKKLP